MHLGFAYRQCGDDPAREHVLMPLNGATVKKVKGDTLLSPGRQPLSYSGRRRRIRKPGPAT